MIIESIALHDFRNYTDLQLDFDPKMNILYGDNAQGKTNILEGVYVAGTTRSHKGSRDREMIRIGADEAHIRLMVNKNGSHRKIDMHLKKSKSKGVAIDGVPVHKSSEIFGMVHLIFFSPEDLSMIKSGPGERRRFMDMELSQIDRIYLHNLTQYNRTLVQRNNLLKQIADKPSLKDTLDVWDEQLVAAGKEVIKAREDFIKRLEEIIVPVHTKLTGGREEIRISYEPNVTADSFADRLWMQRQNDMFQKTTLTGPQRDDISFTVGGTDLRKFGSQGQQRTAALSLKLSEITLFRQETREDPVLLLDDVLSELDRSRQNYLLESIGDIQTMITCTGLEELVLSKREKAGVYKVTAGTVRKEISE